MNKRFRLLETPTIKQAYQIVHKGILGHRNIIIIGNCWVEYNGRASSKLEPGERIVIIKRDGSVLVHRPRDYAPINWQPPGSLFKTMIRNNSIYIRAYKTKENESLEIIFDKIYLVASLRLIDTGEFYLYASEKDMHDAIMIEPSLIEEGFNPLVMERPVESGFIDILGVDNKGRLTVIEVKRKIAGKEAVLQLEKYVKVLKKSTGKKVRGILVGPEISKGVQALLATLNLEFIPVSPKDCYEILGIGRNKKITEFSLDEI